MKEGNRRHHHSCWQRWKPQRKQEVQRMEEGSESSRLNRLSIYITRYSNRHVSWIFSHFDTARIEWSILMSDTEGCMCRPLTVFMYCNRQEKSDQHISGVRGSLSRSSPQGKLLISGAMRLSRLLISGTMRLSRFYGDTLEWAFELLRCLSCSLFTDVQLSPPVSVWPSARGPESGGGHQWTAFYWNS